MGTVGRILARLGLITVIAVGLLWPVFVAAIPTTASAPSDPVVITDYQAELDVEADGDLRATEQITANFPAGRHGIFRYWDQSDGEDPGVRYVPTITDITRDGSPERYEMFTESGEQFLVAKIGDPDRFLDPGEHRYRISYTIPGVISPADAGSGTRFASAEGQSTGAVGSVLLWRVVAQGWEMPIRQATVTVTLPEAAGRVQCSAGELGRAQPCTISGAGTAEVTVSVTGLPPRSGMQIRAEMGLTAPDRASLPWSITWDPVLGNSVPLVVLVVVGSALALIAGVGWARLTHEDPPGYPVQYAPPDGLGPVQVVFMDTEAVGPNPLVATLLHMAERGLVRLERPGADSWIVTGIAEPADWEAQDPVTQEVAAELGVTRGGTLSVHKSSLTAGKALDRARDGIGPAVKEWAHAAGHVTFAPHELIGRVAWVLAAGAAILGFTGLLWPTMWGLPFAAFALGGVGLLTTGVGRRRTTTGRVLWSQAGGFERLLSTPSAEDRFDFAARRDLFIAYIPYAVAFGVADRWAEKYQAATGAEPPIPMWFPYYYGAASSNFYSGGDFDSFDSALSSSISAYTASQSSSGSGGGGGGFSGGGGGGGGGGSW